MSNTKTGSTFALPEEYYDQNDSDNVCYLCNNPQYRLKYEVKHFDFPFIFKKCQCGLIKQTPMPNEKFFEWFFNSELFFSSKESQKSEIWGFYDYFKDEPSRMATSKYRYRKLKDFLEVGRPLDIMKIGPSTGTFLYVAKEHGHNAIGCDISNRFSQYAKDHYGVQIDNGRFEKMDYPEQSFDVILLMNVIENVPNQHEFLTAINKALRPGGLFISNFVDMHNNLVAMFQGSKYFLYRPPICYIYTGQVYKRILEKYGFEIERSIWDMRYLTLEKISTLLRWRWLLRLSSFLRIHQIPFPIYAYPSKVIVARKVAEDPSAPPLP